VQVICKDPYPGQNCIVIKEEIFESQIYPSVKTECVSLPTFLENKLKMNINVVVKENC
jgi:hypothetical protein